jgi:hypothetical protein
MKGCGVAHMGNARNRKSLFAKLKGIDHLRNVDIAGE